MSKAQKFRKRRLVPVLLALLCLLAVALLLYTGIIWPNALFLAHDSVRGLDVSNYQKQIDWKSVAQTGQYTFVFIKATEGETYEDAYFQANWRGTKAQGLLRGAGSENYCWRDLLWKSKRRARRGQWENCRLVAAI